MNHDTAAKHRWESRSRPRGCRSRFFSLFANWKSMDQVYFRHMPIIVRLISEDCGALYQCRYRDWDEMGCLRSTDSFRNGALRSVAQRQKYAGGYSDIRCDITLVILGTYIYELFLLLRWSLLLCRGRLDDAKWPNLQKYELTWRHASELCV